MISINLVDFPIDTSRIGYTDGPVDIRQITNFYTSPQYPKTFDQLVDIMKKTDFEDPYILSHSLTKKSIENAVKNHQHLSDTINIALDEFGETATDETGAETSSIFYTSADDIIDIIRFNNGVQRGVITIIHQTFRHDCLSEKTYKSISDGNGGIYFKVVSEKLSDLAVPGILIGKQALLKKATLNKILGLIEEARKQSIR